MKNRKALILILLFFGIISLLVGVTYSFFNYTKTGLANNFSVGNVSFNTSQDGNISLSNVFPITSEELGEDVGNHDSVTINISGSTNFTNGVEYLVTFTDVNNSVNDKLVPIAFTATGTNIGTSDSDYYENRGSNSSIYTINEEGHIQPDKYILVGYIAPGQIGINGSITITAYVDADRIAITDTPEESAEWIAGRTVFSTEEWSSLKGNNALSFKIRVEANQGVWVDEEATPGRCFTIEKVTGYYKPNPEMDVNACVAYLESQGYDDGLGENESLYDFCAGTGTINYRYFNVAINDLYNGLFNFNDNDIEYFLNNNMITEIVGASIIDYDTSCGTDVIIPETISKIEYTYSYNENRNSIDINNCVSSLEDHWGEEENNVDTGESYYDFCAGTGTNWGQSIYDLLQDENFLNAFLTDLQAINIINDIPSYSEVEYTIVDIRADREYRNGLRGKNITSVVLPNSLITFTGAAFYNNNLQSIIIPNNVKNISQNAFSNNALSNVIIGTGVSHISTNAFADNNLTSITIPDNVVNIGSRAFYSNNITSVILGMGISGLGDDIFDHSKITYIDKARFATNFCGNNNTPDNVFQGTLTIGNIAEYIDSDAFMHNKLTGVVIGNNVISIGSSAFAANLIENLTIGTNVERIESSAFNGNKLTSLTIGNKVEYIGQSSFSNNLLTSVEIGDSVKTIAVHAFSNNNLTNVIIGSGVTSIESKAFYKDNDNSNPNLASITIDKPCSTLKNMSNYPWIGNVNRAGTTIYGSGGEVCDAY